MSEGKTKKKIRQPIISILGHVDHGKTTLLDKIRESDVVGKEAGGITQAIGATEIPSDVLRNKCSNLLEKFKIDMQIPGLLFIDTPGHEAFTTLRKRGGSIADLAVLVVDINEGFKPQTQESLVYLREFKTPFVVVANKIDKIEKWQSEEDSCFLDSVKKQREDAKTNFDEKFYKLITEMYENGFDCDRFDQLDNFKKKIAIVPVSAETGEGIPDLLVTLIGLSQTFLKGNLEVHEDIGKGTILEMKELRGFGTTADTILYDGNAHPGDYLVVGGKDPFVTKIKALLKPAPMKEIRVEKKFDHIDEVHAASGIKIAAPELDRASSGNPVRIVENEEDTRAILKELEEQKEDAEFESGKEGIILKADTMGSLEALVNIFKEHVPIKKASIGNVDKRDIVLAKTIKDPYKRVVIAFNVKGDDTEDEIEVIEDDIIYNILDKYQNFVENTREEIEREKLKDVTKPAKFQILPGFVFRGSNPAVVGVEVQEGILLPGSSLMLDDCKTVGTVKNIEKQSETLIKAEKNDKVSVSIDGPTVGRQINEGDIIYTNLSGNEYKILDELKDLLTSTEVKVLEEIKEVKRKMDPSWGY